MADENDISIKESIYSIKYNTRPHKSILDSGYNSLSSTISNVSSNLSQISKVKMVDEDDISVKESINSIKYKSTTHKNIFDSSCCSPISTISNVSSNLSQISKVSFNHISSDFNKLQQSSNTQLFKVNKFTLDNNRRKFEDITNITTNTDVNYLPSSKKIKLSPDMQLEFEINKCLKYDNSQFFKRKNSTQHKDNYHERVSIEGLKNVDMMYFLATRYNYEHIAEKIFSFLSGSDIISMSMVSKIWLNAVKNSPMAQNKKQIYFKLSKENRISYNGRKHSVLNNKGCLTNISNIMRSPQKEKLPPRSPPVSPSKFRFHVFQKEAKKLSFDQQLISCPRCRRPSSWSPSQSTRAECKGFHCKFIFCTNCMCEYSNNKHKCLSVPILSMSSSSCRSIISNITKRNYNLRRL